MPFVLKNKSLSLRAKFVLLFSGLLFLILSVLGFSFYRYLSISFKKNTAINIRALAKPIIEYWLYSQKALPPLVGFRSRKNLPDEEYLKKVAPAMARDLTSKDTSAMIIDSKGHILAQGKRLPEEPPFPSVPDQLVSKVLQGEKELTLDTHVKQEHLLIVFIPLRESPTSSHILGAALLATRLNTVDSILKKWGFLILFSFVLALIAGIFLSFLVVTWMLSPLEMMVDTCQDIALGHLERRLPLAYRKDEIGRLAQSFNNMVDQLQHTFESQHRFLAQVAHDLHTPLAGIKSSIEILMRGLLDRPEKAFSILRIMHREVRRLIRLCEELLDLTRLESSHHLLRRPISLRKFFSDLATQTQYLAPEGPHIQLKLGPDLELSLDEDKFKQALFNIIENALRYTPKDKKIVLGWQLEEKYIKIFVSDQGAGIPSSLLPYIFKPFYQGSYRKGKMGLGLPLAKAIVEAHGGKISVKSIEGKGTLFEIFLPRI